MAAGTPNILLPWDNATVFQRNLQAHDGRLASWTAWVVPSTMTVAQAAQRAGVSESDLRRLNKIPPRMKLRAGSSLLMKNGSASKLLACAPLARTRQPPCFDSQARGSWLS